MELEPTNIFYFFKYRSQFSEGDKIDYVLIIQTKEQAADYRALGGQTDYERFLFSRSLEGLAKQFIKDFGGITFEPPYVKDIEKIINKDFRGFPVSNRFSSFGDSDVRKFLLMVSKT